MIIGLGSDIVEIKEIKNIYAQYGEKFLSKNFTEAEIAQLNKRYKPDNEQSRISYLAKRFAAKEAMAKALGTGIGAGAAFKDIETLNDKDGKPCINLYCSAQKTLVNIIPEGKTANIMVTLSDTKKTAFATVIISAD